MRANPSSRLPRTRTPRAGGKVAGTYDLYGYQITANPAKALVSVTLPNTRNVVIMALGFGTNTQVVVPGTYVYTLPPSPPVTPAPGAVLPVGTHPLAVAFTPTNTAAYTGATGSTTITVTKATPVLTRPTPTAIPVGTPLSGGVSSMPLQRFKVCRFQEPSPIRRRQETVLAAGTQTLNVLFHTHRYDRLHHGDGQRTDRSR